MKMKKSDWTEIKEQYLKEADRCYRKAEEAIFLRNDPEAERFWTCRYHEAMLVVEEAIYGEDWADRVPGPCVAKGCTPWIAEGETGA